MVAAVLLVGCATTAQKSVQAPDISIHAAFKAGNIEAVKQHLAAGADVNAGGPNAGLTPLHRGSYYGLLEIVEIVLSKRRGCECEG